MLRTCKQCGETKSYDPTAKRESKEMGFVGLTCYSCYRLKVKLGYAKATPQRTTNKARQKQTGVKVMSKPYGVLTLEAQSTLDSWLKNTPKPYSPADLYMLNTLQYKVSYAQNKLEQFGADAYDFKAIKQRAIKQRAIKQRAIKKPCIAQLITPTAKE